MPSARSTLAVVAALVYGTSVLAMPMEDSYDLVERDYSDFAELDARMYDMDLEEYYVREGEATPPVPATPVATAQPSGVPAHHHKHKSGHRHHHKHPQSQANKEKEVGSVAPLSPTTTSKLSTREPKHGKGRGRKHRKGKGHKKGGKGKGGDSTGGAPPTDATPPTEASPAEPPTARDLEVADEMLSAREPKHGKGRGRKHRKGKGHKGKGRKGKGGGGSTDAPPADGATPPADASAAEPPTARSLFTRKVADEKTPSPYESTPSSELKETGPANTTSAPAPTHTKKAHKKALRRPRHRLYRHRLSGSAKKVDKATEGAPSKPKTTSTD